MAYSVTTEKIEFKVKMMDADGNSQIITVPEPVKELTDQQYYDGAKGMLDADALRPFGNQFTKLTDIRLVETTRKDFDLEALNAN